MTLHGILKAGKSSLPVRGTDPPDGPTAAAADGAPDLVKQLRGLLEGLGIDPDALEVRIGIRKSGEQGRPHGGEAINPSATGAGDGRLTSKLLEALTLLCQEGERFMDSAGESRRRMVDTTRELLEGEDSHLRVPKPHMVLTPGDEQRIQGMMLTGWMGKADLLKGWASQGKKKGQPAQGAGEQVYFKHLKVRTEERTLRISALFDTSVPDTTVGYRAAAILGLKGGRACHQVTTADGKNEMSYAWYNVPLLNTGGRTKQVRASGVLSTARIKNGGKNREVYGDPPGEAMGPTPEWECVDLIIGRDNMDCKPMDVPGWRGWPEGGCLMKGTGNPGDYAKMEAGGSIRKN